MLKRKQTMRRKYKYTPLLSSERHENPLKKEYKNNNNPWKLKT